MNSNICERCGGITGHLAQRVAKGLTQSGTPAFACLGHLEPSPRDTQFQGFAEAMFSDVESMFNNRYIELDNCEEQQAEKTKQGIIKCFAECAYDLVKHAVIRSGLMEHDWRLTPEAVLNAIPDLTELPKEQA